MTHPLRKKIAIVGTGISGLGAASLLHPHHDITVYEKNDYIGGHSRTITINTPEGVVPVDTGFIVFNKRNYPLLTRLFEHLQVPIAKSDMSFGVSIGAGWLEYGTRRLSYLLAQTHNLFRPAFWVMLADILKFNRRAITYLQRDPSLTLGQCLDELGVGPWFRHYYILAMGSAIWSTPASEMLQFPAQSFIRFFDNHGLLTVDEHPQWYTVQGGSREYVKRLTAPFKDRILLGCGVHQTLRTPEGVKVIDTRGATAVYDEVVFACHADQALSMMRDATTQEQRILGSFTYQPNRAITHGDTSFMPRRRKAWASWVYLSERRTTNEAGVSLSYWMNNLQPLKTAEPILVTLNPARSPKASLTHDEYMFEHPVFNSSAVNAQADIDLIQGQNRLWFCGAYQRYGFHEDGLASAVRLAARMGITPPWL